MEPDCCRCGHLDLLHPDGLACDVDGCPCLALLDPADDAPPAVTVPAALAAWLEAAEADQSES